MTDLTWNPLLRDQLTWHWTYQLRDRLNGLTDGEYLCEPGPGCWSVRPRGTSAAPVQAGSGALTIDFAMPEPDPPPFTTIAWRLGHIGVLAVRNAVHFGRAPTDYQSFKYAATAAVALAQLDAKYATWLAGLEPDLVLGQIVQRQVTQSRFLQAADPVFGPRSLPVPQLQIGQLAAHGTGGEQGDPPTVGVGEPQLGAGMRPLPAGDHPHAGRPAGGGQPGQQPGELGSVLRVAPNHVCAAVNLADKLFISSGGAVVDRWLVAARARNS